MATKKKAPAAAAPKKGVVPKAATPKKAVPAKETSKAAPKKSVPAKAAPKKEVAAVGSSASAIDKISFLQAQMADLKKEAIVEVKERLSEARGVVKDLEGELASLTTRSTGKRTRKGR